MSFARMETDLATRSTLNPKESFLKRKRELHFNRIVDKTLEIAMHNEYIRQMHTKQVGLLIYRVCMNTNQM